MNKQELITKRLKEIENKHNVKIIMAVDNGSNAYGCASPNSDIDLRFLYVETIESYSDYNEIALGGLTMSYIPFYSQETFDISDIGKIEVNPDWIKEYHSKRYFENNGYIF